MAPTAFLLVFSEPGPNVPEDEYNDWYDNEHIPLRVNTPAFLNWTRWKAVDGEKPTYGASYDLESYEATKKAPYTTLAETRSDREKGILANIQLLDRRHYELIEPHPIPLRHSTTRRNLPHTSSLSPEEDFNKWYHEEHIPLLAKAPGWVRSRRFILKDCGQMGVEAQKDQKPPKYMAVHEWASMDSFKSPEYKAALATPWTEKVFANVVAKERRVMTFVRKWARL
ncbi:uncharacterized protein B0H18DRAFT_1081543 [Fomitopsis serialis]|uniref:uncharacterized protein n=1 Tax=Fomitopsis serialis TaxID=139415 RepID=UPI00200867D5|nr:uncharacterized protein B0H18DRAFT_1081543 [Neoantrodia serialis]KAH9937318.1 hypothetical protein B0H18DRAFT_1081543 [Neoantrodia serialis]